jgi:glycosyltransferase
MKKKRLYVFNGTSRAANYGIGTYIDQLIPVLKDSEWELCIVYLYAQGTEAEMIEKKGYKQINIPYPATQTKNAPRYYSRNIAYLLKEFIPEDKGVDIIFHLNFMSNEYFVKCLKKHFRCKIILISHYTNWSFSLFGDYIRLKKILKKTKNELNKDVFEKTIAKNFEEDIRMINQVDRLVCVAEHTWKEFKIAKNFPSDKTEIINNALKDIYIPLPEKKKTDLRKKYCIPENTKLILFAGRLDEVKGVAFLIRTFKKIITDFPDSRLIVIGEGSFETWLKESADCWSKITFTGRLDKKKLYEFYRIADMGVVCSLHEEFGFVAIEMMMYALPVIVTQTGGLDEIVEDNVSGLKVPVRTIKSKRQVDVKYLSEKMKLLLNNPVYARELGKNGRKRFLDKYEISVFKEKMLTLYNNVHLI